MSQSDLFSVQQELPNGLLYRPDFISPREERDLIAHIARLPFREARFRQYTARRRVVRFGEGDYLEAEPDQETDFPRVEFPPFLKDVRARVAAWLQRPEGDFVHGLVTEYAPGTPIGWHRDAPHFEIVAGISLAGACRMRYRAYRRQGIDLRSRSRAALALRDEGRHPLEWEHSIPPVKADALLDHAADACGRGGPTLEALSRQVFPFRCLVLGSFGQLAAGFLFASAAFTASLSGMSAGAGATGAVSGAAVGWGFPALVFGADGMCFSWSHRRTSSARPHHRADSGLTPASRRFVI